MKTDTRYELRSNGVTDRWAGYFENGFYYERMADGDLRCAGRLDGANFYHFLSLEPSGVLDGLTLTRVFDGVKFELVEPKA